MKIPLVDLNVQYEAIKPEIDAAIARVIESTQFILGPEVKAFEEEFAAYAGAKHGVGVASGTDALHLALLGCGVQPGDEVITPPFTFIATAEAATNCGAVPVFADIDPATYNLDPNRVEARITSRTRVIMPVHLFGQPADLGPLLEIARRHNLKVIEDCAQAHGAMYKGKKVGSIGDAGCFSFFPSKGLGGYGDGGLVTTNDPRVAQKVELLRKHGAKVTYYHTLPGFNSRLDAMQAAILRAKLKHLGEWNRQRAQVAALYARHLSGLPVVLPAKTGYGISSFSYYTIRVRDIDRNKLRKHLEANGVATAVYYPLALHLQEVYKHLGYQRGDFPESERASQEVLSLPMYPELNEAQIDFVASTIKQAIS